MFTAVIRLPIPPAALHSARSSATISPMPSACWLLATRLVICWCSSVLAGAGIVEPSWSIWLVIWDGVATSP